MPRRNQFSNRELRDMICVYAQQNFNSRATVRRYAHLYPNRIVPNWKIFERLHRQLGETGTFYSNNHGGRPQTISVEQEEEILVRIAENPQLSTRRLQAATRISKSAVSRIIHRENLYPFHFSPVQNLLPADEPLRLQFCQNLLQRANNDPLFVNTILFTDEATFTRRGIFNWRNNHYYDTVNPHVTRERHFQHEFSINIWCGIVGNHLIGPFVLPRILNGDAYLAFLQNDLPQLLEEIPLNIRGRMCLLHDGAPAHYPRAVRNFLNAHYPNRWIGRGSDFPWPPRSPDLNPLDFFLWGYMKELVYETESRTRDDLLEKIQEAANLIRNEEGK